MRFNCFLKMVILSVVICSCGSSKSEAELAYELKQYEETKALVATKKYKFIATAAYPLQTDAVVEATNALFRGTDNTGARINLNGLEAFLTVKPDSIKGELAYFGEMRSGNYADDRDSAISFDNVPQKYEVKEEDDKKSLEIKFDIKNATEQFNAKMDVYSNKRAILLFYGANRTMIRYEGSIFKLDQ